MTAILDGAKVKVGATFTTAEGCKLKVIEYASGKNVTVKFLDRFGAEKTTTAFNIKKGQVKNPYHASVLGVGYTGVGAFQTRINGKKTLEYKKWISLISYCYSPRYQKQNTFKGWRVCKEWHNFQTFAQWLVSQPNYEIFDTDKDLLSNGDRIYSPQTCCMLPPEINTYIRASPKGRDLPAGVTSHRLGYWARISADGEKKSLGFYSTEQDAHDAYRRAKIAWVKKLAKKWRDDIDERAYDALMNWTPD